MKKQFLSHLQQVCFYDIVKCSLVRHYCLPSSVLPLCRYALLLEKSFGCTPVLRVSGFLMAAVCKPDYYHILKNKDCHNFINHDGNLNSLLLLPVNVCTVNITPRWSSDRWLRRKNITKQIALLSLMGIISQ